MRNVMVCVCVCVSDIQSQSYEIKHITSKCAQAFRTWIRMHSHGIFIAIAIVVEAWTESKTLLYRYFGLCMVFIHTNWMNIWLHCPNKMRIVHQHWRKFFKYMRYFIELFYFPTFPFHICYICYVWMPVLQSISICII